MRLGIWILIVGFGGFLLWAGLAPLDEGVPCQGQVSIATKRRIVQHRMGGIVESVHVQEGQLVRKGELLLALDSQTAKARYAEVHQRYLSERAAESRLLAELRGSGSIDFHPDLLGDPDRQLASQLMESQRAIMTSRQSTKRLLLQQLDGIRDLVREGYAPRSQQRELEIRIAQLSEEHAAQLAQVQGEVQADAEKSKALARELEETSVRSPVDGQVVGLQVQSVGALVQPGQRLMDIVPLDERLLVEARIAPHLIDRVHVGMPANVQFASFAHTPQLVVSGKVASVSGDLITETGAPNAPMQSYYLARVLVTASGMKALGSHRMQAGMPVQVIVRTGERSLLTYLMHPLVKRLSASMKEE